jgi:hypothetical protein
MSVTAPLRPPRPDRSNEPLERDQIEALVEALIEEARQETRRRRRRYWAAAALLAFAGVILLILLEGGAASNPASSALSARSSLAAAAGNSKIVFIRDRRPVGGISIWVMNADGSEERQLAGAQIRSILRGRPMVRRSHSSADTGASTTSTSSTPTGRESET